jgi:tRNA threonylcarbamoyladenosine biosynthesis protein TsaE
MGYDVLLTRDKDIALAHTKREDIYKRVSLINNSNTLLYVSIHANSYPNKTVKGAQCFYDISREENKLLASYIMEMLKTIDPYNSRKEKSISGKYLINNSNKIGCLIEVGFLSNPEELALLNTKSYQEKLAYGIFLGILKYLGHDGDIMSRNNKNNIQTNSLKLTIPTPTDMERLGWLIESISYPKIVFAMNGNLGAGKTTLTKGLGKALGIKRTINSPTFTIMKVYEGKMPLYHLDVYRVEDSNADFELEEYFDLDGISVVEWADNISDLLPPKTIYLTFTILENGVREVEFVSEDTEFIDKLKDIVGEYIC